MATKTKYIAEKVVNVRTNLKNETEYEVVWKDYRNTTWEPEDILLEDCPKLVEEFNEVCGWFCVCVGGGGGGVYNLYHSSGSIKLAACVYLGICYYGDTV